MKLRNLKVWTVVLLSAALNHCGGSSRDSKVDLSVTPKSPVVINSNITFPPPPNCGDTCNPLVVSGPWFQMTYAINNQSDLDLTVASLQVHYETLKNGAVVTGDQSIDPGSVPGSSQTQTYLLWVKSGMQKSDPMTYYLGGLPDSDTYIYSVTITLQGWYGTPTNPQYRIYKSINFNTQ